MMEADMELAASEGYRQYDTGKIEDVLTKMLGKRYKFREPEERMQEFMPEAGG